MADDETVSSPVGPRDGESRQAFLARVARAHDLWVQPRLETSPFRARGAGSDYNIWYVDVEATGDDEAEFITILDSL